VPGVPCAIMRGTKALMPYSTPRKLILVTDSQADVSRSRRSSRTPIPALRNTMSIEPWAAIVLDDADPKKVAPKVFESAFMNCGQICAAVKRVYVHESVYDDLVGELASIATERAPGLQPLSTRPQFDRVTMLVADALEHGGKAVTGGEPGSGPGYFYPPTILTHVGPGVRVVDEEQFGPVLPVIPFSDLEWAIEQANGTEYGLCGSVWSASREPMLTRALPKVVRASRQPSPGAPDEQVIGDGDVGQVPLVLRDRDGHGRLVYLSSLSTRRAFWLRNFGQTSSLKGTRGMSEKMRSSESPIGK
jgi:hypothetical protein